MAKVSEYKKKLVEDMVKLMRQYPMVGVVDMNNLPAPQLQSMRAELRGKISLFMTKKRLMKIALEKIKNEKKNIEELEKYLGGMPALIFSNDDPFKLSRILQKSKTSAPAKAGQIAPNDIIINKGPTPFAPGPVISELSSVGLKVGVESGKVAIKEDAVVAKKGEKIKPKVAEILTRLDIKPMQVGLGMVAVYENGIIYQRDILEVDEKAFNEKVNLAATQAFNLAFNITYTIKDNINLLLAKAFNDAKAIGISQRIFEKGIIEQLLSKAEMEMFSLKDSANIEIKAPETKLSSESEKLSKEGLEKPKVFQKGLEKSKTFQKEEPKPEVKEEPKKEEPKQAEPKPEEKKIEAPTQEKIEKKEEKILEEEEEIIEEEKKLEEEKPKEVLVEKEVQEAVKIEEEKKLEKERIEKEKELERVEKQKAEEVDKKVKAMVEKTKKFAEGKEETAEDILKEVKKEEQAKEEPKQRKLSNESEKGLEKSKTFQKKDKEVPTTHDLKSQKEEKEKKEGKETKDKDRKEVEDLTKELLKKGTLRK